MTDIIQEAKDNSTTPSSGVPLDRLVIPIEVLDLVRFLCDTVSAVDEWAHETADGEALISYLHIQGVSNKRNLHRIGEEPYKEENIKVAVAWMLKV